MPWNDTWRKTHSERNPGDHQGCSLTFTHVFDDRAIAAQTAAGWECYFDRLEAHLSGEHLSEQRAHEPIGERHERYAARFALDPAPGRKFIATALDFRGFALDEGDGPVLRLERRYDQPVERVWRALTDPIELQHWFPGELEIIERDPPRRLVGSWQGDPTRNTRVTRMPGAIRTLPIMSETLTGQANDHAARDHVLLAQ